MQRREHRSEHGPTDSDRPDYDEPVPPTYREQRGARRERGFDDSERSGEWRGSQPSWNEPRHSERRDDWERRQDWERRGDGLRGDSERSGASGWGRPSEAGTWNPSWQPQNPSWQPQGGGTHRPSGSPYAYQGGGSFTADRWTRRGPHTGRGPKNYRRSDEHIIDEVNRRLQQDGDVDATEIEVSCSGGVVKLEGSVSDREAKRAAEECAESVDGVHEVLNHLRVDRDFFSRQSGNSADEASSTYPRLTFGSTSATTPESRKH